MLLLVPNRVLAICFFFFGCCYPQDVKGVVAGGPKT